MADIPKDKALGMLVLIIIVQMLHFQASAIEFAIAPIMGVWHEKGQFLLWVLYFLVHFFAASYAYAKILVISPHPDDDVLIASGIVYRAVERGEPVKIVYMTNGDLNSVDMGYIRQGEAVAAQAYLGVLEDQLIFLGYPDYYLSTLYSEYTGANDQFTAPNGKSTTYGNRGLGRMDYHSYRFGSPARYNSYKYTDRS